MKVIIETPKEFSFDLSMQFLKRSPKEILHQIEGDTVVKLLSLKDTQVLFRLSYDKELMCEFLSGDFDKNVIEEVKEYTREWFDLDTNLKPFYKLAKEDKLLAPLAKQYYGYRIIGQPDLFESLIWAVLGQQINLGFAYTLKQRFVEKFGDKVTYLDKNYHLFPSCESVSRIDPSDLLALQFSNQKARYTVGIAEAFAARVISKEKIKSLSFQEAKEELMKIKGIGNWTANYALMKTFRYPNAFPLEDAGLHNAIKNQLGLKEKPRLDRVSRIFKKYKGWEAYATLYLWKSL